MNIMEYIFWASFLLLVYIYAGYPFFIAARACLFPRPVKKSPFSGTCSLIIAARNEADNLPAKIESILAQSALSTVVEIVIGSDASTDRTAEVVRSYADPRIKLVEFTERRGKPSVLNDLMHCCTGDVVIMNDARQRLDPKALETLLAPFADPGVGVVSGELVFEGRVHSVPGATGALYAIRRSLFKPIPPETILDDVAIPMQAVVTGMRCIFEQGARVYDKPSSTAGQESVRKRRTIAGVAQLIGLYPEWLLPWKNPIWLAFLSHKVLRLLSPIFMLNLLIINVMLHSVSLYQLVGIGQIFFYGAAIGGWVANRKGLRSRILGIPLMFVALNISTLYALWDAIRGRYRVVWTQVYRL